MVVKQSIWSGYRGILAPGVLSSLFRGLAKDVRRTRVKLAKTILGRIQLTHLGFHEIFIPLERIVTALSHFRDTFRDVVQHD